MYEGVITTAAEPIPVALKTVTFDATGSICLERAGHIRVQQLRSQATATGQPAMVSLDDGTLVRCHGMRVMDLPADEAKYTHAYKRKAGLQRQLKKWVAGGAQHCIDEVTNKHLPKVQDLMKKASAPGFVLVLDLIPGCQKEPQHEPHEPRYCGDCGDAPPCKR
eukprot:jgi/Chrzof1/41/Cz01g01110.t1